MKLELSSQSFNYIGLNINTVFADLVGFTAWSSTRDPAQVFTLLETLYKAFDSIASRRGVFKVRTVRCVLLCLLLDFCH
jgi:hypothetical protein